VLSADLALGRPVDAAGAAAIPLFVVLTAAATAAVSASRRPASDWRTPLLATQLVLLVAAGAIAVALRASSTTGAAPAVVVALLAVGAMAVQNALLHLTLTPAPSTAVMTGNTVAATAALTRIVVSRGADADAARSWRRTWPLLAGFLVGCLVGAAASGLVRDAAWALPVLASAALLVISARADRAAVRRPGTRASRPVARP
jgi:uncharacterized membrane protein YoaK (UPF0700 family)